MKGDPQVAPMPVGLVGSNWFNHGWLYGVLGLPVPQWDRQGVELAAIMAFRDGWASGRWATESDAVDIRAAIIKGDILAVRESDV